MENPRPGELGFDLSVCPHESGEQKKQLLIKLTSSSILGLRVLGVSGSGLGFTGSGLGFRGKGIWLNDAVLALRLQLSRQGWPVSISRTVTCRSGSFKNQWLKTGYIELEQTTQRNEVASVGCSCCN